MTGFLSVVMLGFLLGMRHATDPDHVIAVTTIVSRYRSIWSAAMIGIAWGIGHTMTIVGVGGAIILFGWTVPPGVELSMEFAVGLMLVILGLTSLRSLRHRRTIARSGRSTEHVHTHAHRHGDYVHTHAHAHDPESHPHRPNATPLAWLDRRLGGMSVYQLARPLLVGVVHGLAGSAAATLLILAIIGEPGWALAYLGVFGVGTIAGMMLITAAVVVPFAHAGSRAPRLSGSLRAAASALSIVFGLWIVYQIGVVDGLLRAF